MKIVCFIRAALTFLLILVSSCQFAEAEIVNDTTISKVVSQYVVYPKKFKLIEGKKMAYIDIGQGYPIVFLHGNPTSSYLWRDVMPYMEGKARLVAPDLIGMGDSEKLDNVDANSYSYAEHKKYLFALLSSLNLGGNVTLVLHDWGSALGFDWASQHAESVKGIAFMEALVSPFKNWNDFTPQKKGQAFFKALRSEEGESMILKQNQFIERLLLPGLHLDEKDKAYFRMPYLEPGESRRPTLSWPRQIPIAGQPLDVAKVMTDYSVWLGETDIPKLFVNAEPGAILTGERRSLVRSWKRVTEVTVPGQHFIPNEAPNEIGRALRKWYQSLD